MRLGVRLFGYRTFAAVLLHGMIAGLASAQTCTTQSQMKPAEREALAGAATSLAQKIAANDQTGVKAATIPEFQKDFAGISGVVSSISPGLQGARADVEQVYVLDASSLTGTAADAQFECALNQSQAEVSFAIPQLPPGRYGFAMVRMEKPTPYRLSFLLRQQGSQWQLAGLYPKPLTAGNHDGLWYWKEARGLKVQKQVWNAWLYLQEAQVLLQPAGFVSSSHLDKLQTELTEAAPPEAATLSSDAPLVLKASDGTEYRFTSIATDDSLGKDKVEVAAHLKVDALGDAATARKRNVAAMAALVAAHPELRNAFHGVWIFADAPGSNPYATEQAMSEIH